MCDSVPSAGYSSVCNVLRLWRISLIPTYRAYQLYDTDSMITGGFLHSSTVSVGLAPARPNNLIQVAGLCSGEPCRCRGGCAASGSVERGHVPHNHISSQSLFIY